MIIPSTPSRSFQGSRNHCVRGRQLRPEHPAELREWVGNKGQFAATSAKRVVYGSDSLKAMAEEFAADYCRL